MASRAVVFTAVLAITIPALGKPPEKVRYTVTELPGVNPGVGIVFVSDVNDRGTVVGGSSLDFSGSNDDVRIRPIKWTSDGALTELPVISTDGIQGGARGINAKGTIVGISHVPGIFDLAAHAVVFDGDPPTDLGTLPGDGTSFALRVNNAGTAVGFSAPEFFFFGPSTAVRWDKGGIASLGVLPGDLESEAHGINEKGVIVGLSGDINFAFDGVVRAVYWDKTGIHALPGRTGDVVTAALAVNDAGVIVGTAADALQTSGFLFPFDYPTTPVRWVNGKIEELPLLPGDNSGRAFAVNSAGTIVGESAVWDDFGFPVSSRPVVWINGKVIDLNAVETGKPGWVFSRAAAVNNRGQIAGTGAQDGVDAGFLATPNGN